MPDESPYVAMREFIRVAVELEVRKAILPEIRSPAAPPELNYEEVERRVWERIVPKLPAPPTIVQPKDGKDAVGIAGVTMRSGDLILRLSDGTEQNVGRVIGEKGDPGSNGKDGEDGSASIIPGPKGDPGERGADGIATREELHSLIEERMAEIQVRTFADVYQGVYENGRLYERGLLATWGGSLWLSKVGTKGKPGESPDWSLVVKRGDAARK